MFCLEKVISGGETGVDQYALHFAKEHGFKTSGTIGKGFMTENGSDLSLKEKFGLIELEENKSVVWSHVQRSMKNVDDSDGTLVIRLLSSVGTDKTIQYCINKKWESLSPNWKSEILSDRDLHRPVFIIETQDIKEGIDHLINYNRIIEFIEKHNIRTLNVAGHRESKIRDSRNEISNFLSGLFLYLDAKRTSSPGKRKRNNLDYDLDELDLESKIKLLDNPPSSSDKAVGQVVDCDSYLKKKCNCSKELIEKISIKMKQYNLSEKQHPQFLNLLVDLYQIIDSKSSNNEPAVLQCISNVCNGMFGDVHDGPLDIMAQFQYFLNPEKLETYIHNAKHGRYDFWCTLRKDISWREFWKIMHSVPEEHRPLSFVQEKVQKHVSDATWNDCFFYYINYSSGVTIDVATWLLSNIKSIEDIGDCDSRNVLSMIVDSGSCYNEEFVFSFFKEIFKLDGKIVLGMIFDEDEDDDTFLEKMARQKSYSNKVWNLVIEFMNTHTAELSKSFSYKKNDLRRILNILKENNNTEIANNFEKMIQSF